MRRAGIAGLMALAAGAFALIAPANAQEGGKQPAPPVAAPPAAVRPAPQQPALPDAETIVVLIRTAVLTLNDALRTGNFTVLRDIAAPGFRDSNTAARLSQIFLSLQRSGVDLAPVAVAPPQLAQAPLLNDKGMLRLTGNFPLTTVRIDFDLLFEPNGGRWRLFGIAVQPSAPMATTAPAPPAPDAKATAAKPLPDKKGAK
jgi:hypothetical protein